MTQRTIKLTNFLLTSLAFFIFISQSAFSDDLITNTRLKNWIKANTDKLPEVVINEDGGIENTTENLEALAKIEELNCIYGNLISIDELIRHMPNLKKLMCYKNALIELDLSNNIKLEVLNCYNSQLTSLDVSKNIKLTHLYCYENLLTNLDISKNIELVWLECYTNQLSSLDVSNNIELKTLMCSVNPLINLDVSKNIKLEVLYCYANQLSILDLSNNVELKTLMCSDNQLTNLDVSNNIKLTHLDCNNNQLNTLDISNNIKLTYLSCSQNQLTNLDLTNNLELGGLSCSENQLINLDVSKHIKLTQLHCNNNQLTSLDISPIPYLRLLSCCNQAEGFILYLTKEQKSRFTEKDYCSAILKEEKSICEIEWLDIHPNPTADKFFIESKFFDDEIKILNLAGEVLYREILNTEKTEIDISNLPAGVYFVITKGKIGKVVKN
ncbi:MAG: T9SS type A sorting domain-containing protein [Ignavibacteria bacterium]|nr:T9SS type A sorting domain-containing protein [Ignavibacteria bacterium]